jgi:hypothetical protein
MKRTLSGVFALILGLPLSMGAAGGPAYEVSYSTGPNQSLIYYLEQQGRSVQSGVIVSSATTGTNILNSGLAVGGPLTTTSSATVQGISLYPPSVYFVGTSTQITPSSTYVLLYPTNGGSILMGSLPTISTATALGGSTSVSDGTFIIVADSATTGTVAFQDNSVLSGTRLNLGGFGTRVVSSTTTLSFVFSAAQNMWNCLNCNNSSK